MGCTSSKVFDDLTALAPLPSGDRRRDPSPDLTADELMAALNRVAAYLHQCGRDLRLVVVGGAVATLLLRLRTTTHDIDFFTEGLTPKDSAILTQAIRDTRAQSKTDLGENLFNNKTIHYIDISLRRTLEQEALVQNDMVFQAPGLTLHAAPWTYAFVTKFDRIKGRGKATKDHDPLDAADFLDRHLQRIRRQIVSQSDVKGWLQKYLLSASQADLDHGLPIINEAYLERYGSSPITR